MAAKLKFEHHKEPLLPRHLFARRVLQFTAISFGLMLISLAVGICGYHYFESMPWIDALLNASMIMGGMGPVESLHTARGKLFASFYAIYCGGILLIAIGIFLAPVFHRVLHRFHLDLESSDDDESS